MFRLTKYGWPQVVLFPAATAAVIALFALARAGGLTGWLFWPAEIILTLILIWMLSFFRDPERNIPHGNNLILSPADGKITDIEVVEDQSGQISGKMVRIGIFLSIFNVHLNRAPCNCSVDKITYRKGSFKNAMSPGSGRVNESNDLELTRTDEPKDRLIVRQISGAIARRIVCRTGIGQNLTGGQRFGMIKFGSRTELYLPARTNLKLLINIGDKVKAGITVVAKYQ
jgi:phosphatidylserine decarboxylase